VAFAIDLKIKVCYTRYSNKEPFINHKKEEDVMTEEYVNPCTGCPHECPACSLVGECYEKKVATLKRADEESKQKKSKTPICDDRYSIDYI
jgi:hypothetical protein